MPLGGYSGTKAYGGLHSKGRLKPALGACGVDCSAWDVDVISLVATFVQPVLQRATAQVFAIALIPHELFVASI